MFQKVFSEINRKKFQNQIEEKSVRHPFICSELSKNHFEHQSLGHFFN